MEVLAVTMIVVLISTFLILIRAIKGPTTYDKILAVNSFGTKTMVVIALLSDLVSDSMYLDIALVYALINFIATIAILKYVRCGSFGKE